MVFLCLFPLSFSYGRYFSYLQKLFTEVHNARQTPNVIASFRLLHSVIPVVSFESLFRRKIFLFFLILFFFFSIVYTFFKRKTKEKAARNKRKHFCLFFLLETAFFIDPRRPSLPIGRAKVLFFCGKKSEGGAFTVGSEKVLRFFLDLRCIPFRHVCLRSANVQTERQK